MVMTVAPCLSAEADAPGELEAALAVGGIATWRYVVAGGLASWDARMFRLHGITPRPLLSRRTWLDAIHPDDAAVVNRACRAAARGRGPLQACYRIASFDGGEPRWVRLDGRAERDAATGHVVAWRGIAQDVTEQRATEEALRRSEARLRRIQRIGRVGGFEIDLRTGRNLRSPEYMAVQGHAALARTERHRDWVARLHPEDRVRAERAFLDAVRDGPDAPLHYAQDYRIVTPQGETRWISARAEIERDAQGRALRMLGAHLDVTELRAARDAAAESEARFRALAESRAAELARARDEARQSERMAALGQLTGGVAHDFANWLQVMMSGLTLLERGELAAEDRAAVIAEMTRAGEAARETCARMLAFSRRQGLAPQAFDLNAVIGSLGGLVRRSLPVTVELVEELAPALPQAHADPGPLEAAVMNLVVNARDAMPGGGRLTLRTFAREAEGRRQVCVAVEDTGAGMPPEVARRAFEPFFTTKGEGQGTGLGLAQVFGFAQESGGECLIESAPGCGTTVTLALPAAG